MLRSRRRETGSESGDGVGFGAGIGVGVGSFGKVGVGVVHFISDSAILINRQREPTVLSTRGIISLIQVKNRGIICLLRTF